MLDSPRDPRQSNFLILPASSCTSAWITPTDTRGAGLFMKDSFYLKHDFHSREDRKFSKLIRERGYRAYGLAWAIIERIYEEDGRLLDDEAQLVYDLRLDIQKDSIEDLRLVLESDLFYRREDFIGSERVDRELSIREDARAKASFAGRASAAKRALNDRSTTVQPGEERRGEEGKERTTAPAAVDSLVDGAVKATDDRLSAVELETATLPFGFGEPPDRFEKGVRIQDLSAETCRAIIDLTPRLGFQLTRMLRARIAQKKEESRR